MDRARKDKKERDRSRRKAGALLHRQNYLSTHSVSVNCKFSPLTSARKTLL